MAFTARTSATGVNGTQTYSFPFTALDEDHIQVTVDGTAIASNKLTVDLDAGEVTIGTGSGGHTFVGGEAVIIFRDTPILAAERIVQPTDEGSLSQTALATLQLQILYSVQELFDALGGDGARGAGFGGKLLTWLNDGDPASLLDHGTDGQVLTSQGAELPPSWEDPTLGTSTPAQVKDSIDYREVRAFNVGLPEVGASEPAFYTDRALTVEAIYGVLIGSDTPSVDVNLRHSTDRSATGNTVFASDVTITSTSTATSASSGFDDHTIPAGSWVWLDITAVSGTVDFLTVELRADITIPS